MRRTVMLGTILVLILGAILYVRSAFGDYEVSFSDPFNKEPLTEETRNKDMTGTRLIQEPNIEITGEFHNIIDYTLRYGYIIVTIECDRNSNEFKYSGYVTARVHAGKTPLDCVLGVFKEGCEETVGFRLPKKPTQWRQLFDITTDMIHVR